MISDIRTIPGYRDFRPINLRHDCETYIFEDIPRSSFIDWRKMADKSFKVVRVQSKGDDIYSEFNANVQDDKRLKSFNIENIYNVRLELRNKVLESLSSLGLKAFSKIEFEITGKAINDQGNTLLRVALPYNGIYPETIVDIEICDNHNTKLSPESKDMPVEA